MKAFLRYYVEIPLPAEKADEILGHLPGEWLDQAAREANIRALLMLGGPGVESDPAIASTHLSVLLSPVAADRGMRRHSLEWFEVIGDTCEPVLRGDLELAELGPARTQLALSAQYRPLLCCLEAADRAAAVRVGESTLKAFIDRIADYMEAIYGGIPSEPGILAHWRAAEIKRPGTIRSSLAPTS